MRKGERAELGGVPGSGETLRGLARPRGLVGYWAVTLSGMAVDRAGFEGTEALVVTVAGGGVALASWLVVVWKANLAKRLEEKIDGEG